MCSAGSAFASPLKTPAANSRLVEMLLPVRAKKLQHLSAPSGEELFAVSY